MQAIGSSYDPEQAIAFAKVDIAASALGDFARKHEINLFTRDALAMLESCLCRAGEHHAADLLRSMDSPERAFFLAELRALPLIRQLTP